MFKSLNLQVFNFNKYFNNIKLLKHEPTIWEQRYEYHYKELFEYSKLDKLSALKLRFLFVLTFLYKLNDHSTSQEPTETYLVQELVSFFRVAHSY